MTLEILIVLTILAIAVILFIMGWIGMEVVGLLRLGSFSLVETLYKAVIGHRLLPSWDPAREFSAQHVLNYKALNDMHDRLDPWARTAGGVGWLLPVGCPGIPGDTKPRCGGTTVADCPERFKRFAHLPLPVDDDCGGFCIRGISQPGWTPRQCACDGIGRLPFLRLHQGRATAHKFNHDGCSTRDSAHMAVLIN